MPKRKREVRYRGETETASPGPVEDVRQEDQIDERTSSSNISEAFQANDGEHQEGNGDPTDETPNWQNEPLSSPSSSSSSEPWDPDNSAGSQPLNLGPPRTDYYPESEVIYSTDGWSYEVYTYNETYKISTIPTDFIGNTGKWPKDLGEAYNLYKQTEASLDYAIDAAHSASWAKPIDHARVYELERTRFNLALPAATQRANFMKRWPSAFNRDSNTAGHIHWAGVLIDDARVARREGLKHFQKAWPTKDPNEAEWLAQSIDPEEIVGLRTYAMSPNQYNTLRQIVQAKKVRIRYWAEGSDPEHWRTRLSPNPTVFRPNLPPPNPKVLLPMYSRDDDNDYSLPDHLLGYLASDACFV